MIIFFNLFCLASSYRIICAVICTCDITEEFSIAECNGKGLSKLPIFQPYIAYKLTRIYLNNNNIGQIQMDVLMTWRSAEIIDLAQNPIDCDQLSQIPSSIRIITDCRHTTTSITTGIYIQSTIKGESFSCIISIIDESQMKINK